MLLVEIDDTVGLNAQAETRSNRNIACECFLADWTSRPVIAAREQASDGRANCNGPPQPHSQSSGVHEHSGGRALSTDNIPYV